MNTWILKHMNSDARERYTPVRRFLKKLYWYLRYPLDLIVAPLPSVIMYQASYDIPLKEWKTVQFTLKDHLNIEVKNPVLRGNIAKSLDNHMRTMLTGYRNDTDFLVDKGCIDLSHASPNLCTNLQHWRRAWMIHMAQQLRTQEREDAMQVYGIRFW